VKRIAIALALALTTASVALAVGADWTASWESIRGASRDVRSIQASFVQSRSLAILAHPIVSRGKLAFRRPADLRWEYQSPIESVIIARGGDVGRYVRRDGKLVSDSASRLDALSAVFGEIQHWLAGEFASSKVFRPELVRADAKTTIVLHPTDAAMQALITSVTLELGSEPGMVTRIVIDEGAEGSTRIDFADVRINGDVGDERFVPR
jgi:outer membrane lipoprotein-sorting protein